MEAQSASLNLWASFWIRGKSACRKVCLKPAWLKSPYLLCTSCTELPSAEKYKEHRLPGFKSFNIACIVQKDFMTCPFALVMICCSTVFH